METLVIIIAFWLILLGIYGALPIIMQPLRRHGPIRLGAPDVRVDPDLYDDEPETYTPRQPAPSRRLDAQRHMEPQRALDAGSFEPPPKQAKPARERAQPVQPALASAAPEGVFNEVEALRAQVDSLRSEIASLSSREQREQRAPVVDEEEEEIDEEDEASAREPRFTRTTRVRRYRTGLQPDLPRHLRKQVKEVRNHKPAHA